MNQQMNPETSNSVSLPDFGPDSPAENWVISPADLEKPLNLQAIFGNEQPLELEIGIGSGYFLTRYAQNHPDINILGVDKVASEVMRSADKARRLGVTNIRTLQYEALILLEEYIEPETFQRVHVYYSDPWPKKKHHRRRVWKPEFVRAAWKGLKPDGELYMKTDVSEYFEVIDKVIKTDGGFENRLDCRLDEELIEGDYETNFQRKAKEKGHPLHYQIWKKINHQIG